MSALTLSRARAIVEHAEQEFSLGARIDDAFIPFEEGGAISRQEARNALLIVVADAFRLTGSRASPPTKTREMFEGYARTSRLIATRIIFDDPAGSATLETAAQYGKDYESFISFIRMLDPKAKEFWPNVYGRLGIPSPTGPISFFDFLRRKLKR